MNDRLSWYGRHVHPAVRAAALAAARAYRRSLRTTCFVAVTGSSGKTTTKTLIDRVLAARARGVVSFESRNTAGEIVRTLLRTRPWHTYCVQEIGAFRPGGIRELGSVFRPRIAVVTVVAQEHRKAFPTLASVAREKSELVRALPPDGWAVLNGDDPFCDAMRTQAPGHTLTYGTSEAADLRASDIRSAWPEPLSFLVHHAGDTLRVQTRLHGRFWTTSVLAALGAGIAAGVPLVEASAAIGACDPIKGRMSPVRLPGDVTFIRDDWKNPEWSLSHLYDFLREARANRRVLILGSISDSRQKPKRLYRRILAEAEEAADAVLLTGQWAHLIEQETAAASSRARAFRSVRELNEYLKRYVMPGDLVVLRANVSLDHLERLFLDRIRPVGCWRVRCGVRSGCDTCSRLYRPFDPTRDADRVT